MDLKEFISESLLSIVNGVKDAQEKAQKVESYVNPGGLMSNKPNVGNVTIWDNRTNNYARQIEFDIAVTVEKSAVKGSKIKVVDPEIENQETITSRIQFSVPILLPAHNIKDPKARFRL